MMDTQLEFILPGTWWRLPMNESGSATDAAIKKILDTSIGRRDQDAQLRADARRAMRDLVEVGRDVGAEQIHFAKNLVGALPFPATLMVSWPEFPVIPRGTPTERAEMVADAMPDSLGAEMIVMPQLCAARTVSIRPGQKDKNGELVAVARVDVSYYLAVEGVERVSLFSFTTALVGLRDQILELFDAIVSTVSTRADVAESRGRALEAEGG